MPIPIQEIVQIYEHIQEQINIDYVSVVIYTAIDVDSLCSIKMLSKFFKGESIQFHVHPVINYSQLDRKIEEAKESYRTVKMFMFINCGGLVDLTESWFIKEGGETKVFLFDSNKPIHHKNLEHKSIFVVDDEHSDMNKRLTSEEMKTLQELDHLEIEQIENEQEDEDEEEESESPKRNSKRQLMQKLRQKSQFLHEKMNNYYGSSYVSAPTSYSLYRFIRELKKASNHTLWYAILGLTSLYLQNSIPRQLFTHLTNYYRADLVQFNPQGNQKKEKGQIFLKKGYNFPLMNHWSLYESMMNSPYLMQKLSLWNDKGITKLHEILTKLGISLEQAKQNYKYMLKEMKDALQAKIFTITTDYDLGQISFESFMRQTDSSSSYMVSDFYYIIASVLEKPVVGINQMKQGTLEQKKLSKQQLMNQQRIVSFWNAYNLLEGSQEMLKKAVEQYKEMSAIMMKQVRDIIERDSIMNMSRKLNFSNIRCDTRQKKLLQHPSALMRLAYMLMGIQKQRQKQRSQGRKAAIPYVLSLLDIDYNVCLVVGVTPERKNHLGSKFNEAVEKHKLHVQHDKFTPNVIVLEKENLLTFIMEVGQTKKQ